MLKNINWEKVNGLLPAIIQSTYDQSVLMLGYMNPEALQLTQDSEIVHFYSRTKQRIWKKGEISGNILKVVSMHIDCDSDTLLIIASPKNHVCHNGFSNCFSIETTSPNWLLSLEKIIEDRIQNGEQYSYVKTLASNGIKHAAQKVAEEGVEVAIASIQKDQLAITEESADLLFHLLVNLKIHNLNLSQVISCLQKRNANKTRG